MEALNIDLTDPRVRAMLDGPGPGLATGNRPAVVQIAGDVPDPTGMSRCRGAQSTTHLTDGKHEVVVVYKGMFMTVDVYAVPGQPLMAHLYCPRCHKHATVKGEHKAIDYEPASPNPMCAQIRASGDPGLAQIADLGRLSIEAFECPWELGDDQHVSGGMHTGMSLCRMRLAIDNNRAQDA